jgi:hypothetical protein
MYLFVLCYHHEITPFQVFLSEDMIALQTLLNFRFEDSYIDIKNMLWWEYHGSIVASSPSCTSKQPGFCNFCHTYTSSNISTTLDNKTSFSYLVDSTMSKFPISPSIHQAAWFTHPSGLVSKSITWCPVGIYIARGLMLESFPWYNDVLILYILYILSLHAGLDF